MDDTSVPQCYGQALEIPFSTSTDLATFMPPGLRVVHPHRAFISAGRFKLRSAEADRMTAAFTQYHEVCITTLATTPQFGPRRRNILRWVDRAWAVGSSMLAVERWAEIHMPPIFELDHKLVAGGAAVPFFVEVRRDGHSLLSFSGVLDGEERVEHPAHDGYYVGGEPGADLLAQTPGAARYSRPLQGTGTLRFGAFPGEQGAAGPGKSWPASLLADIEVEGSLFQEVSVARSDGSEYQTVRKALPGNGRSRL